jgi:hypothetical protein
VNVYEVYGNFSLLSTVCNATTRIVPPDTSRPVVIMRFREFFGLSNKQIGSQPFSRHCVQSLSKGTGLAPKLVTAQGLFFTEAQVDLHRLVINGSGISDLSLGPVASSHPPSDSDSHTLSNQSTQQPRVSYLDSNSGDDPQVEILLCGGRGVQHDPFRISFSALDEIQRAHELPDELFEQFQAKKGYFTATHLLEREVAGADQSLSHALRYVNVAVVKIVARCAASSGTSCQGNLVADFVSFS